MKTLASRAVVITGALALGGVISGCEIITTFDRSLIDASVDVDAAPYDATFPDAEPGEDANAPDSADASTGTDAGDSSTPDAKNPADSNVPDTNVPDSNVPDSNVPDSNVRDSNVPDTDVPDTNVPDTNVPDTNVPDTNVPDTNPPPEPDAGEDASDDASGE